MIRKIKLSFFLSFLLLQFVNGQQVDRIVNEKAVADVERTLSSDEMGGRRPGSAGIDKAATFISEQFRGAGLKFGNGANSYLQSFITVRATLDTISLLLNDTSVAKQQMTLLSALPSISINDLSRFRQEEIRTGENFFEKAMGFFDRKDTLLVWVDTSFTQPFARLVAYKPTLFQSPGIVLFVLGRREVGSIALDARLSLKETPMANVVGVLPGKQRPQEIVIFSAHYDHLGTGKPNAQGDSIFNGANDDASGTTAVILLAKYFASLKNNERTLVFAAFTAEESGGYGSRYFSQQFDPLKISAMFNIEMIGTESKWGRNSAFITGFEKTDMGSILQGNLKGSAFTFHPDPYPAQNLFYRSDNATLARLGVPAHTISTSKMDSEKYYHTQDDEFETLDMSNMAEIIQSIALSARSIVSGKDTPTRVDTKQLK